MPTFGETTKGGSSAVASGDYVQVFGAGTTGYTCPEAGTVSKLSGWFIGNGSNQAMRPVIYADSAGTVGALLATGPEVVVSGSTPADTLIDFPLTTPLAVTATTYWLGFHFGATSEGVKFYWSASGNGRKYKSDTYSDGSPASFGAPSGIDTTRGTVYATYTVGTVEHFGAASLDLTDTIAVAAKKNAKGAVAVPLTANVAVAARKNAKASVTMPLAFNAAVQAKRNAKGSVTLPLSFNISVGAAILAEIVPASVSVTSVNGTGATFADTAAAGVSVTIQNEEP